MAYDVLSMSCIEMYSGIFNPCNFNQSINWKAHNEIYVLGNPQFVFWDKHACIKHLNFIETSELFICGFRQLFTMLSMWKTDKNNNKLSKGVKIKK